MVKIFVILFTSRVAILILPIILWQIFNQPVQTGIVNSWVQWDAPHFVYIAQNGYTNTGDQANFIVFPPLYPILIKLVSLFLINYNLSAVCVSMFAFSVSGCLFYKLVTKLWDQGVAKKSLFLLAIFPTTYFFTAAYTESTFWLATIIALLLIYNKKIFLSGVFVGLAFLGRIPGILVAIAPLFYLVNTKSKIINYVLFIAPIMVCIGLYLVLNFSVFGDPLAFQKILNNHWQKSFEWPWVSLNASWLATKGGLGDEYALQVGFWEAIPATMAVIFIPFVWKYLKNTAWSSWYTLNVVLITSTSFLLSTPRYLLSIPPLFVFLAIFGKKYPLFYYIWVFLSGLLLTYFSMRYVTGEWSF